MAGAEEVTGRVLAAMHARERNFSDLTATTGLNEVELANVVYRLDAADSSVASALAVELRQPPGTFDDLIEEPKTEKESKLIQFLKWIFENFGSGLIVAIAIILVQQTYQSEQEKLSKAAAAADAVSTHLANQSTRLIEDFRAYVSVAEEIDQRIDHNDENGRQLQKELMAKENSLTISLQIMEPFAPTLEASGNSESFLETVRATTSDIRSSGRFESFEDLSEQFAEVVQRTQIDIRDAVKTEYEQARRRNDEGS